MLGVTLTISASTTTMITNLINGYQKERSRKNADRLADEIKGQLTHPDACRNTLNGIPLNSGTNVTVSNVRDHMNQDSHTVTRVYGNGSVILNNVRVFDYSDTVLPEGKVKMLLQFEAPSRPGIVSFSRTIELDTQKVAGFLTQCSSARELQVGRGPWTTVPGGVYTTANVGIGTSAPAVALDVKGGWIHAQLDCRTVLGPAIDSAPSIARCDDDEFVISGGVICTNPNNPAYYGAAVDRNQPLVDLSGWSGDCYSANPELIGSRGTIGAAQAICCKR